jgi:hypothetical protein
MWFHSDEYANAEDMHLFETYWSPPPLPKNTKICNKKTKFNTETTDQLYTYAAALEPDNSISARSSDLADFKQNDENNPSNLADTSSEYATQSNRAPYRNCAFSTNTPHPSNLLATPSPAY